MQSVSVSNAELAKLLEQTASAHEPFLITGPSSNAVLIAEEDWNAIQETLHLLSIPGMRESIRDGLATPLEACERQAGW